MASENWIRHLFLGRVYSTTYEDPEDGGPYCAIMLEDSFRWSVIILSVCTN